MRLAVRPRDLALDALVLAAAALGLVEAWWGPPVGPVAAALVVLATMPLLARRRFPFAAPVVVLAGLASVALTAPAAVALGGGAPLLGVLLAFWVAGAHRDQRLAAAATALGVAAVVIAARSGGPADALETADVGIDLYSYLALGLGAALAASAFRRRAIRDAELAERAARVAREHDERTRSALTAERNRIARDLHDVIAHNVGVMTVQAGAARLLLERRPDRADEPLRCVVEAGREAMAETRRLFGILARDDPGCPRGAQPTLDDLEALYGSARRAGLTVDGVVEGDPRRLPPGVGLAAYRIVQEALTNTLTHAGAAGVRVALRYHPGALEIEIVDDGRAERPARVGHGLVGMRERAEIYGGRLTAGPRAGGGWAVNARLRVDGVAS